MQSLRSRRPSAAGGGSTSGPSSTPKRSGTTKLAKAPTLRNPNPARKSTVDDKIKKRMSLRYAEISAPSFPDSVPAMPSLPSALRPGAAAVGSVGGASRGRADGVGVPGGMREQDRREEGRDGDADGEGEGIGDAAREREDARALDKKLLGQEDFDPDSYLKEKLANSTEAELKSLQSSLRGLKDDTAVDLQRDVFKNYAEFVFISKEISVLENELLELKESLTEWKNMPSLLHIDESASAADRRRNLRSSIADLRVLYAGQMQTLHTQIEGAATLAPTTPGRHVVHDLDGVLALNPATYRPTHTVKFVVLDDAVLIAKRRRRVGGAGGGGAGEGDGGKLVAERCWPLIEMLVLDTKDTSTLTNVFKVRHGRETYVFRTEAASDKRSLLAQFRTVAEELGARRRREREGENERRKSLYTGSLTGSRASMAFNPDTMPAFPEWMAELAQRAGGASGALGLGAGGPSLSGGSGSGGGGGGTKEKDEQDARWVGDFTDELTVAIALRQWENAVALVEKGTAKQASITALGPKLAALRAQLEGALLGVLAQPNVRKAGITRAVGHLVRLGAAPAARRALLAARGEAIRGYVRAIRFEGHVGMYVHDLSLVVFSAIKHTADWYLGAFSETEMSSGFIDWAKTQLEAYADMFRKQVFGADADQPTIDEALAIAHAQHRKVLQEFGLDFRFLLDRLLVRNPPPEPEPSVFHFPADPQARLDARKSRAFAAAGPAPTPASVPPTPTPPITLAPAPASAGARSRTPTSRTQQQQQPQQQLAEPTSASASRPRTPTSRTQQQQQQQAEPTSASRSNSRAASPARPGAARPTTPTRPGLRRKDSDASTRGSRTAYSPAPPPRSTNRPSMSAQRPPPVAVPQRDGMF
ncbi:hypothetical protein CONPUDRAFT_149220 [Coniophora puteana RWD-64-598 SS2]|uniref:Exocyst complex component EXO84 n=1 Tax=Coniophora puteana (strain RWD-64-598) TaxID=741705 RepID=A0A5M3N7C5_CONPW|nr:uncharacterized protein CONPUDRAFT_149220 [Coniophora puteana RWD-64-598 SS2]EIW87188.1 hypothetical protein CONPUDRAFT_149220 [Coniophora puteana RWD-64-598 SS2]